MAGNEELPRQRNYNDFVREVCNYGGLTEWEAEEAAATVLCAIEEQLPESEPLPGAFQDVLDACPRHEHSAAQQPERNFLQQVAHDLDRTIDEVEIIVRAVIAAVRGCMSREEALRLARRLPAEIGEIWKKPFSER